MLVIVEEPIGGLAAYETVSIAFTRTSRLDLPSLQRGIFVELPHEPLRKDYDVCRDDRPTSLPHRFQMKNWLIAVARDQGVRVGGVIVAFDEPGVEMLEARRDLASVFDLRVAPEARGRGIGARLFRYACEWARGRGCAELTVETQDTNVGACRFYKAQGCGLGSVTEGAYGAEIDEAKIIWRLEL